MVASTDQRSTHGVTSDDFEALTAINPPHGMDQPAVHHVGDLEELLILQDDHIYLPDGHEGILQGDTDRLIYHLRLIHIIAARLVVNLAAADDVHIPLHINLPSSDTQSNDAQVPDAETTMPMGYGDNPLLSSISPPLKSGEYGSDALTIDDIQDWKTIATYHLLGVPQRGKSETAGTHAVGVTEGDGPAVGIPPSRITVRPLFSSSFSRAMKRRTLSRRR